jgi:hypothetical protein
MNRVTTVQQVRQFGLIGRNTIRIETDYYSYNLTFACFEHVHFGSATDAPGANYRECMHQIVCSRNGILRAALLNGCKKLFASPASLRTSWEVFRFRTASVASRAASFAFPACTHAIELNTTPAMLATVPTMVNNQFQSLAVIHTSFALFR